MIFEKLEIPGIYLLKPERFTDERGFFSETYNKKKFDSLLGKNIDFVQDNFSESKKGVIRGIHFQEYPHSQAKLVRVSFGKVFDVAVDLRKDSQTYLKWVGVELSAENGYQLWIPEGFGHAFLTLSNVAHFAYKTSSFYDKDSERTILWNDPKIGINWPEVSRVEISEKDLKGMNIE